MRAVVGQDEVQARDPNKPNSGYFQSHDTNGQARALPIGTSEKVVVLLIDW